MKQIKFKKDKTLGLSAELQARIPVFLIYTFFIFWFYLVAKNYYSRNPIHLGFLSHIFSLGYYSDLSNPYLFDALKNHLVGIVLLLLILFAGYGLGTKLFGLFKIKENNSLLEKFVFSTGLGLGGIIAFIFGIGILGLLYKSIIWTFLVIFCFFGLWGIVKQKPLLLAQKDKFVGFEILWILILCLTGLIFLIGALTPDTYYDSMVYYLNVPQHWVLNHRIIALPHNFLSQHPFNISLLYVVGLMLRDEILAKLIHFTLGILTIVIIYIFCKKYFNRQVGLLAAAIFYTVPVVGMVSQRAGIELGLAFFETLAVFAFINWCQQTSQRANESTDKQTNGQTDQRTDGLTDKRTNGPTGYQNKWLIISGIFTGLAMGGKYTSFFCAFGLFVSIIVKILFFDKNKLLPALKSAFLFGIISMIVASPWLIKSFINTGNPVWALSPNLFGNLEIRKRIVPGITIWSGQFRNILFFPWTITMAQQTQEPFPGPIFLLILPLLVFFGKVPKVAKHLAVFFSIYYLFFALWMCYLRYFIPSLPVISIILAIYILRVSVPQVFRKIFLLLICLAFLGNIYFILLMQKLNQNPLPFVLGLESKEEFLFTQRGGYPNPYYGVINWANQNLPKTAKILFIGEARDLYAKRETVASFTEDFTPIVEFSRSSKNGEELWKKLKEKEITHILFNVPEARRLGGYDMLYWEGEDLKVFLEFWNSYVKEIYKDIADISIPHQGIYSMKRQVPNWWQQYASDPRNYVYLCEILSPEEAEKPHPAPLNLFFIPELYTKECWQKIKNYFHLNG